MTRRRKAAARRAAAAPDVVVPVPARRMFDAHIIIPGEPPHGAKVLAPSPRDACAALAFLVRADVDLPDEWINATVVAETGVDDRGAPTHDYDAAAAHVSTEGPGLLFRWIRNG